MSATKQISIRMYNVGFGDSFLLTFPDPDRPRKVFIDCGYHAAGPPPVRPLDEVVKQIINDIGEGGAARLDVVVATHRHRDHVFGFENSAWSEVRVTDVWMPWTEHPTDPEARRIREAQAKKAKLLADALAPLKERGNDLAARAHAIAENNLTNAKAMAMLHGGFAGNPRPRFLPEKPKSTNDPLLPQVIRPDSLPGVTVHVLGPDRDSQTIKDMDPPDTESYLRLTAPNSTKGAAPLDKRWSVSPSGEDFGKWFEQMAKKAEAITSTPEQSLSHSDQDFETKWFASLGFHWQDVKNIDRFVKADPLLAAASIDQAVNGTSLMLAFEIGRAMLLFPGDAQWGTWNRALNDPPSRAILERTNFLKVGHHGSHNASPKAFVKGVLGSDFQAMVSTRRTKLYKDIPRLPLLNALEAKQESPALARSDEDEVPTRFRRVNDICIEALVPV